MPASTGVKSWHWGPPELLEPEPPDEPPDGGAVSGLVPVQPAPASMAAAMSLEPVKVYWPLFVFQASSTFCRPPVTGSNSWHWGPPELPEPPPLEGGAGGKPLGGPEGTPPGAPEGGLLGRPPGAPDEELMGQPLPFAICWAMSV